MISVRTTPHVMRSPEELESWLSSQKRITAPPEDVPPSWIEASASLPNGLILLTSKSGFPHLCRIKGDEVDNFAFETPLPEGQAVATTELVAA